MIRGLIALKIIVIAGLIHSSASLHLFSERYFPQIDLVIQIERHVDNGFQLMNELLRNESIDGTVIEQEFVSAKLILNKINKISKSDNTLLIDEYIESEMSELNNAIDDLVEKTKFAINARNTDKSSILIYDITSSKLLIHAHIVNILSEGNILARRNIQIQFYKDLILIAIVSLLSVWFIVYLIRHERQRQNEYLQVEKSKEMYKHVNKLMQLEMVELDKLSKERGELQKILFHSHKMQMLGQLSGGVAHEFNNILTPIMLLSGIIKRKFTVDEQMNQLLEGVVFNCQKAKEIIAQVYMFSGQMSANENKEICNIAKLIDESIHMVNINMDKSIDFIYEFKNIDGQCNCNKAKIITVIHDVMKNATQAILDNRMYSECLGKINLELNLLQLDEPLNRDDQMLSAGFYAIIRIKDNGVGIDGKVMPYIFDPFYTTREVGEGVGMGLAVSYGVIADHNGKIFIASDGHGCGTVCEIYLPLIQ